MKKWTISVLAKEFGLSRSTLLYYDSIGLLRPIYRTEAGYRLYSDEMRERLRLICSYRETGMSLKEIASVLDRKSPDKALLEQRLAEINKSIRFLRIQQQIVMSMLGSKADLCSREVFVKILKKAGLNSNDMEKFHLAFESSEPLAHHDFLSMLGFSEEEIQSLKASCR